MRGIYQGAKWSKHRERRGFTIVELLIVVVVIAILAAITVVAYNGIANSAKESALKTDPTNAAKQLQVYKIGEGHFPDDGDVDLKHGADTFLTYAQDGDGFCVAAVSVSTPGLKFSISDGGQITPGTCPVLVTTIAAGGLHTCALAGGEVYCWGNNSNGRLGDGTTSHRTTPVAVNTSGVLGGKMVTAIAAGSSHTCALAGGGDYCWGSNCYGRLGDGTTVDRYIPVVVNI